MENNKPIHCTLTDNELAAKADQWIDEIIASGGKSFVMHVPARPNADPDLIFSELNNRFKALLQENSRLKEAQQGVWVKTSERLPEKQYNYHVKATSKHQGYTHNDTALWKNNKWVFLLDCGFEVVEWLDESATSNYSALKERAEKMEEFIDGLINFPPPMAKKEMGEWIDKTREDGREIISAWKEGEKEVELSCMVCGTKFMGPEPQTCCSGRDCGCMGLPVDPIVCSKECYEKGIPLQKGDSGVPAVTADQSGLRETIEDIIYSTGRHSQEQCTEIAEAILRESSQSKEHQTSTWIKDALEWAKEAIQCASAHLQCPQSLVETWGNHYMNAMHAIEQAQCEIEPNGEVARSLQEAFLPGQSKEGNKLTQERADFIREANNRDLGGLGNKEREIEFGEYLKMLPYYFTRGIGWEDRNSGTTFTTEQLWNEWNKQQK